MDLEKKPSVSSDMEETKTFPIQQLNSTQTKPTQANPAQVRPTQANPAQVRPAQANPAQVRPTQANPAQVRPTQANPAQVRPAQANPAQVRPTQANPAQVRPAQANPAQVRPTQANPAQVRPAQANPAQVRPAQANPAQVRPTQANPAQVRPTQANPAQVRPAQANSAQVRPTQANPAQVRPAQANPAQVRPTQAKQSVDVMDAKTTEVKYSDYSSAKIKQEEKKNSSRRNTKKKEKQKFSEGEGGNTVISMIKAIVYIVFVVTVSIFASIFIILVGNDVYAFVKNDEVREVVIPEYATLNDVAEILHENEIIAYPQIFKLYAVAQHSKYEFVAGTYSISPMNNYEELLDSFKEKVVQGVQDIMIPEGYTTDEIIDLFVSKGIGTREGFIDVINNYDFDYWFIDELGEDWAADGRIYRLDGYLFPDTYQFYNNSSEVTVIRKLLKRFNQIFNKQYREQCASMGYTVDEMITLASIVEKEAGSAAEFFYVSSVFHNRLNKPGVYPKLESDATIVYAIQHDTGERPNLTGSDLLYDTPYNTYTNNGLPPGPIANPSASAILAALTPTETNYHFFVSDGGVTYFSETKAEHDVLVAQIREKQQSGNN